MGAPLRLRGAQRLSACPTAYSPLIGLAAARLDPAGARERAPEFWGGERLAPVGLMHVGRRLAATAALVAPDGRRLLLGGAAEGGAAALLPTADAEAAERLRKLQVAPWVGRCGSLGGPLWLLGWAVVAPWVGRCGIAAGRRHGCSFRVVRQRCQLVQSLGIQSSKRPPVLPRPTWRWDCRTRPGSTRALIGEALRAGAATAFGELGRSCSSMGTMRMTVAVQRMRGRTAAAPGRLHRCAAGAR